MRPITKSTNRRVFPPLVLAWLLATPTGARCAEAPLHVSELGAGPPVVIIPWLAGGGYGFRHVRSAHSPAETIPVR